MALVERGSQARVRRFGVLALALLATSAVADPPAPQQAGVVDVQADQVLAAVAAHDEDRLKDLASKDGPDPWVVADTLVGRGELDAALAFAKASPRPDTERLPEYLESRRGQSVDAAARAALDEVERAWGDRPADEAVLAGLARIEPRDDPVFQLRLLVLRALALGDLGRREEAGTLLQEVADEAERRGWLANVSRCLAVAADYANQQSRRQDFKRLAARRVEMSRRRAVPRAEADALESLARAHRRLGENVEARSTGERAEHLYREMGDLESAEKAAFDVATTVEGRERKVLCEALMARAESEGLPEIAACARCLLGTAYISMEEYGLGVDHLEAALPAVRKQGNTHNLAVFYQELGRARLALGDPAAAEAAYREAVTVFDAIGRPDWVGRTLQQVADVQWQSGRGDEALESLRTSRDVLQRVGDSAGLGETQYWIASYLSRKGNHTEARAEAAKAIDLLERAGNTTRHMDALRVDAFAAQMLGDFESARKIHERCLGIARAAGDTWYTADSLLLLGQLAARDGEFPRALELGSEALAVLPERFHRDRGRILQFLAEVLRVLRRYDEAIPRFKEAARAHRAAGESARAVGVEADLSELLEERGEYAASLDLLEASIREQEAAGGTPELAMTHQRVGQTYLLVGDVDRARSEFQASLRLAMARGDGKVAAWSVGGLVLLAAQEGSAAKVLPLARVTVSLAESSGDRHVAALSHALLEYCLLRTGDLEEARAEGFRVREIRATLTARAPATDSAILALVHQRLGEHEEALRFFEEARSHALEVGDRVTAAVVMTGVAAAHLAQGDAAACAANAREAIALLESGVRGLDEEVASTARQWVSDVYTVGTWACLRTSDPSAALWFQERGRSGALLEVLGGRDALQSVALPEELLREENEVRAALAAAQSRLRDDGTPREERKSIQAEMGGLQDRFRTVVQRIQREAKAAASMTYPQPAEAGAIRSLLGEGEVLVEYGMGGKDAKDLFDLDEGAVALVVTRDGVRGVRLGSVPEIEALCAALTPEDVQAEAGAATEALRKRLVEPLGLAASTRRVFVSPDGPLAYVPFALLLPDREVAYVPSGTTYSLLRDERPKPGEGVLAIGDPDPGTLPTTPTARLRGHRPGRLPGTRVEAEAVGDRVLLDQEATESAFRKALAERPRWHAVHLGCHGLIDSVRPVLSSLALTPSSEDDGFLSMLDVFRMRVPADLVVLSACETARGKVCRGEGVMGLARAFMFAGSPRVICSLWEVDDEATQALMTRFYALWNPKDGTKPLGPAAALKAAQEHVRSQERWSHPYYWAAWTLWGLAD